MGTLKQDQFPLGWTPNSNESNGDQRGLLRADNLVFTEDGIVGLSKGCRAVSSALGTPANTLYSRSTSAGILRYYSENGNVARNTANFDPTSFGTSVISGGDSTCAAFGNGWGKTVVISGTQKKLDDGITIRDIELGNNGGTPPLPIKPSAAQNPPPTSDSPANSLDGQWVMGGEGTVYANAGNYVKLTVDGTSFRGIAHNYNTVHIPASTPPGAPAIPDMVAGTPFTWDTTSFNSGPTGKDTPNDLFSMDIRFDPNKLEKIRIECILTPRAAIDTGNPDQADYYFHEWYADTILDINPNYFDPDVFHFSDTAAFIQKVKDNLEPGISFVNYYKEGQNFWGVVQAIRSQFKRIGSDDSLSWKDVKCIRVTFKMTEAVDCYFWKMKFTGGADGQLNGWYQYVQVNCYDSGITIQRSPASLPSDEIQVIKANCTVTPGTPPNHCNKIEIYRSSTQTPGFFLVKSITGNPPSSVSFTDNISDIDALRDGISIEYYRATVPDNIRYIIGPYYQRMIFFDYKSIYPGMRYDYGSYDTRHVSAICSTGTNDVILWVKSVIDGVILVGTTRDIYQIRGDFAYDEVTGLLNYSIEPLGITQVPVSSAVASYGTSVIYMASDGWRELSGSTTNPIIDQVSQLYREIPCHGIQAVGIGSHNQNVHSCCVSRNRLICAVNQSDSTRALHIFDFKKKLWSYWKGNSTIAPLIVYTEEDGTVIFGSNQDRKIYEFDWGYTFDIANQAFLLRTTYSNDGKSAVRKDPLALTIRADTGGSTVTITLRARDNNGTVTTKVIAQTSFTDLQSKMFNLSGLFPSIKDLQLEITDTNGVSTFKFNGYSVDYVDHPTEVNYLLIPNDNLGTAGRKRMPTISFVMDTQGNNVSVTPIIDATPQPSQTVNSDGKRVHHYYFTSDVVGYTRAITFSTGVSGAATVGKPFELYEVLPHRALELLPDPVRYLAIPPFNFGTTKRKRIIQFAFDIDTRSSDVTFTPQICSDGTWTSGTSQVYNTPARRTVLYYFTSNTVAIDVNGILSGASEFEFYGLVPDQMVSEPLPAAAKFLYIPPTNMGTTSRKRIIQYAFIIDTKGSNVTFTPYVDGSPTTTLTVNTNFKKTVLYYFTFSTIGIDIYGTLSGANEFEFYGLSSDHMVSEALPAAAKYLHIPYNNLGTTKRKRFIQYGLIIDTKGSTVVFTPYVDGQPQTSQDILTTYKDTVIYFFSTTVIGQDIGGILTGVNEFEFYGVAMDQTASEALPAATTDLHVNLENLGTPNKKRIRTIPFVIDTHGMDIIFTPKLDGVTQEGSTHNTTSKRTVFHYFTTDVFPVDIEADIHSASGDYFEFYGISGNVIVETLPVGRLYDQVGPIEFNRQARVYGFRLQVITENGNLNYHLFAEDVTLLVGQFATVPNLDQTLEVNFMKGVSLTTMRLEFDSASPFYRLKCQIKIDQTGSGTDNRWVNV